MSKPSNISISIEQKAQAQKELAELKKRVQNLETIINTPDKPIMERVNSFHDILQEAGISWSDWQHAMGALTPLKRAKYTVELICEVLNEGKVLDCTNCNHYRYFPWFEWKAEMARFVFDFTHFSNADSGAGLGPRLCLFSSELAKFAGTKFEDEFNTLLIEQNKAQDLSVSFLERIEEEEKN